MNNIWNMNELQKDIWERKYQYKDETFDEWLNRITNNNEDLKQIIIDKKFLFGGRILANRGLNKLGKKITYSNCYVLPAPEDSLESIFECSKQLARTFSYGGGVGIDISKLRPNGAKVNNTAETTTGSVSFMDLYSHVTGLIGQKGRRGALMLSIDINHPDIEEFIDVKTDLNKVTKANISVRITNDFMKAVKNNERYICKFEVDTTKQVIKKEVNARELFLKLCKNNWDYAEPGILYWDRIENYNLLSNDKEFKYAGVNPCFTGDMKLLTDNGFKKFEELCNTKVNIVSYDGKISEGKVWCNGEKDTIKLCMSNGTEITCTPDHKFMTIEGNECEAKNLKNKKIMPKIYKTINNDELFIKLGFIQGDGQLNRLNSKYHEGIEVNIGEKDGDISYLFKEDQYTKKSEKGIYLQGYKEKLKSLGFSQEILPNRVFPTTYDSWSLIQKSSFLQGCFSANGCVNSNKRISYKTTCEEFANQLIDTLEKDFKITANLTVNKKHKVKFNNGEYECRESYDVNINKYNDILIFAQYIGFYQNYKKIKLIKLIESRVPYVRNIKNNGKQLVYDFNEPINHWGIVEGYVAHNCGEEPLPAGGSCLLGSFNLDGYVKNGKFNYEEFKHDIPIVVKAMNEVLDEGLSLHPLDIQRQTVKDYRQIGIGVMGIADMLIHMKLKYGSKESIDECDKIGKTLANGVLKSSALLSKEYGTYPKYKEIVLESDFIKENAEEDTLKLIKEYGLRNSQLLTIAPTGTISTMWGISGGIEPIFAFSYTRKTESLHNEDKYYKVYTKIVEDYINENNVSEENLPNYFVNASTINPYERVLMQSTWQKHIDASISSTINLSNSATIDEIYKLYMYGWELGLKGLTIYRDGCKREGILTTEDTKKNDSSNWLPIPNDTTYIKKKIHTGCGKLILFVGYSKSENKITDVYVKRSAEGGCVHNIDAVVICMSGMLRLGGNLDNIEKAFSGCGTCNSFTTARLKGKKLSKGRSCPTAILNAIKEVQDEINNKNVILTKEEENNSKCPECGETVQFSGGCVICPNCGYSKCS